MTSSFEGLGGRSARIVQELRQDITRGVFTPGSRLPTERELCARFEVTRPTVRRAVAKLVDEKLLQVRGSAGMFVSRTVVPPADNPPPAASRSVAVMFPFDRDRLLRLQELLLARGHLLCAYSQYDASWDPAHERAFLEGVKAERCKALIAFCSPREPLNTDLLEQISAAGTRVVHIEPYRAELPGQSFILADYHQAGATAVTEFLLAGCTDIRVLGMGGAPYEKLVLEGVREALLDHRPGTALAAAALTLAPLEAGEPAARRQVGDYLDHIPAAAGALCCTAQGAAQLLHLARERHIEVPGRLRVICVDFDENAMRSKLDTLQVDHTTILREAVECVLRPEWCGVRKLVRLPFLRRGTCN